MPIPEAASDHYRTMQGLQALVVKAGERSWSHVNASTLTESWLRSLAPLLAIVEAAQRRVAFEGAAYAAATLAEQRGYVPPDAFVDVDGFAGYASDGRPMDTLLYQPAAGAQALIDAGAPNQVALQSGLATLSRILTTQIADTGRQAGGIDIAARQGVGYVRMTRPGACPRCAVLAGKWFRWNTGFLRHPHCSCVHVANRAGSTGAAQSEGLVQDPYEAFRSLPAPEQDRIYGQANAQALRDGADISQVVNARRGMTTNGIFTAEGTTRFGNAATGLKPGQRRLTPDGIYEQGQRLGKDRQWTLDRLEEHGYVLPGGQNPTGSLRGQREGYGQLGTRGGPVFGTSSPARAAQNAIDEARRTGVRDPRNRYTMTAAERRLYDAERRYKTALTGTSPYSSPGFGNTPDPYGLRVNRGGVSSRPVTQAELARAERDYRLQLATGGQNYTS